MIYLNLSLGKSSLSGVLGKRSVFDDSERARSSKMGTEKSLTGEKLKLRFGRCSSNKGNGRGLEQRKGQVVLRGQGEC